MGPVTPFTCPYSQLCFSFGRLRLLRPGFPRGHYRYPTKSLRGANRGPNRTTWNLERSTCCHVSAISTLSPARSILRWITCSGYEQARIPTKARPLSFQPATAQWHLKPCGEDVRIHRRPMRATDLYRPWPSQVWRPYSSSIRFAILPGPRTRGQQDQTTSEAFWRNDPTVCAGRPAKVYSLRPGYCSAGQVSSGIVIPIFELKRRDGQDYIT